MNNRDLLDKQRRISIASQVRLASHKGMISLREPHKGVILQSAMLPSVLDRAFKGEL